MSKHYGVYGLEELDGSRDLPLVVWMEDDPIHDVSAPFCGDPTCMCHNDAAHCEYIEQPILAGLLTPWEGSRLYWGEAI